MTTLSQYISGSQRLNNYSTCLRASEHIHVQYESVAKLIKKDFNFVQVKLTDAKDGQLVAITKALEELDTFIQKAGTWADTQIALLNMTASVNKYGTPSAILDVELISSVSARMLKLILRFDRLLTKLETLDFKIGHDSKLRQNHWVGFINRYAELKKHAARSCEHYNRAGKLILS